MELDVRYIKEKEVVSILLHEEIDSDLADEYITTILEFAQENKPRIILLDFSIIQTIMSAGIGAVALMQEYLNDLEIEAKVMIYNLHPHLNNTCRIICQRVGYDYSDLIFSGNIEDL